MGRDAASTAWRLPRLSQTLLAPALLIGAIGVVGLGGGIQSIESLSQVAAGPSQQAGEDAVGVTRGGLRARAEAQVMTPAPANSTSSSGSENGSGDSSQRQSSAAFAGGGAGTAAGGSSAITTFEGGSSSVGGSSGSGASGGSGATLPQSPGGGGVVDRLGGGVNDGVNNLREGLDGRVRDLDGRVRDGVDVPRRLLEDGRGRLGDTVRGLPKLSR